MVPQHSIDGRPATVFVDDEGPHDRIAGAQTTCDIIGALNWFEELNARVLEGTRTVILRV